VGYLRQEKIKVQLQQQQRQTQAPKQIARGRGQQHSHRDLESSCLIIGDFNAYHTSLGNHSIDQRGRELMKAMDELDLTHLNDGTLTRVPFPPSRGSGVNLSLTSGRTRFDFE
jgi:hypothetical protein